jgi:predicted GIY-YIG superfamily endonuclease
MCLASLRAKPRCKRHREARSAVAIQMSGLLRCARNDGEAMPVKQPAVYIMANKRNGTLYTGVTSDIVQRVHRHKQGTTPGFASGYACKMLVYYEIYEDMLAAIAREKQIKAGSRTKKLALIEAMNPDWKDLYEHIL